MFALDGKKMLVVGGASGIGEAIVRASSAQGADVAIADSDTTAAKVVGCQTGAAMVPLDVTDWESVQQGIAAAVSRLGYIDILVNSAGVMHVGKLHETSLDEYDRIQAVNSRGAFLTCRAVIDSMRARRAGNIINIASVAGLIAVERRFSYCVSKGALVEMTRALAIDYATEGIRANAICPGTVDTPMIRNYVAKYFSDDIEGTISQLHARQPLQRMARTAEIAALAVYLASDESSFMTGAAIPIDGGWTAK
jgi:NAD(P)-dependent dehydrogenase (short-subunit alcohol dehydrogenase family)